MLIDIITPLLILDKTKMSEENDPVPLPIDGILDLHTFRPKDLKDLIPDYIAECRARRILQCRIIHGKGIGELRRTVHAILDRLPEVVAYRTPTDASSWGATIVELLPLEDNPADS
jgi:DNA-nicking Smr family endonuclease